MARQAGGRGRVRRGDVTSAAAGREDVLAQLTDVVMRLKEAFEDQNPAAIAELLAEANINLDGRFVAPAELTAELRQAFAAIEQPTLDIISIEESSIQESSAFIAYLVEGSWVDQKTWEERSTRGLLSLRYERRKQGWVVRGLTYARRPEADRGAEPAATPSPGLAAGAFGLGSLFGAKDRGTPDIFSIWY